MDTLNESLLQNIGSWFKKTNKNVDFSPKFNKMETVKILKHEISNIIKQYFNNIKQNPSNKQEYYNEMLESIMHNLELQIGQIRDYLDYQHKMINEDVEDKSIIRYLKYLLNKLNLINEDTPIVEVEKLLVTIYKKIKQHYDLNFNMAVDDAVDSDDEDEEYKKYQNIYFYFITDDFNILKKHHDNNSILYYQDSPFYKKAMEIYRPQFEKEWKEKYRDRWIDDEQIKGIEPHPDDEKEAFNRLFKEWFNQYLNVKFNDLWEKKFRKEWLKTFTQEKEKEAQKERLKISHLKETINNIFKG